MEKEIPAIDGFPKFGWDQEKTKEYVINRPLREGDQMIIYNGQGGFDHYVLAEVLNPDSGRQHRVVLSKSGAWGGKSFYRDGRNCRHPQSQTCMIPPVVPALMEHLTLEVDVRLSTLHGHSFGAQPDAVNTRNDDRVNVETVSSEDSASLFPSEVPEGSSYQEGSVSRVFVDAYERNPKARAECIEIYGYACSVCGVSFEDVYGELGKGFIHVHHLVPLSEIGEDHSVNPKDDLRPVCPNCHAMLHREKRILSIEDLRLRLEQASRSRRG